MWKYLFFFYISNFEDPYEILRHSCEGGGEFDI